MGFKEFSQPPGKRVFIRPGDLNIDFRPLFQTQHDQLKRRLQIAGARMRSYKDFAIIGRTFLDEKGRGPAMNAGRILNDSFDFNHIISALVYFGFGRFNHFFSK